MIATSVNTGKDHAAQFYREMTTKVSRAVKRQCKLCGNDPAKPSCRESKYLRTLLKLILLRACGGYVVESLP